MSARTPADRRGLVTRLYCATDSRRRAVKVGVSANVMRRVRDLNAKAASVLRDKLGIECAVTKQRLFLCRTWAIGQRTRAEAQAVEAVIHAALRERAPEYAGEWFLLPPSVALAVIDAACDRIGCVTEAA